MKKINDYRKLLGVTKDADLKELKNIYRNAMKASHPDKVYESEALKQEAEEKSAAIIEAYHFLVSIAPETLEQTKVEFEETITTSGLVDFHYEKQELKVIFANGNTYEFFGVPHNIYNKMLNSGGYARFVRRHIAGTYTYRSAFKQVASN
jgi:DnaJ-class molecular chaperone